MRSFVSHLSEWSNNHGRCSILSIWMVRRCKLLTQAESQNLIKAPRRSFSPDVTHHSTHTLENILPNLCKCLQLGWSSYALNPPSPEEHYMPRRPELPEPSSEGSNLRLLQVSQKLPEHPAKKPDYFFNPAKDHSQFFSQSNFSVASWILSKEVLFLTCNWKPVQPSSIYKKKQSGK